MPQFTTISPTHISGQKPRAWEQFRDGGYVAIGWLENIDLAGKSIDEITDLIRRQKYDNEAAAIQSFERFLSLKPDDYVAVNNTNHGLFGVGIIKSEYKFQPRKHDSGDAEEFYPHYRDVKWIKTEYMPRASLVSEGETPWQPYGTVGKVYPQLPPYIARIVGFSVPTASKEIAFVRPADLKIVIDAVEVLRKERNHMERAHESLVEDLFVAIGYRKHKDIKYRQGRVDIKIEAGGHALLIVEVKADWDIGFKNAIDAIKQAYNYAHDQGVRNVIVTNGDTYILFDRMKGLSWESNLLGEFQLTALEQEDLLLIDRLRPARMISPDPGEALRHLAESFSGTGLGGSSRG
jgi:predicted Mrr-cat superfamily restriction endonuclease